MGKDWRLSLLDENELTKDPIFRHDLSFVGVSNISKQYYCEAKVEQAYINGEIPTELKDIGTNLHDEIFAMEQVNREELVKHIEKAPSLAATFRLCAEVGKLRVIGQPDAVVFEKGLPKWLIELKTTQGDHTRMWRDQVIQVRIYSLLLEKMGFDCSKLKLVLIRMRQKGNLDSYEKEDLLALVHDALKKKRTKVLETEYSMKFFILAYIAKEAEEAILWAQDYWLNTREPIPTKKVSKCKSCEYNDVCTYSLFKANQML